eukprot:TRINITY_DN12837_c0_g1_i1.p2 TRINITY_DN12837_c0_g1~~TRINITY_DN12837_c0_g1_i1.p2  ORF type:complete len:158 (-),score=47.46 TRINITY_DN12837_c0_g1_i1:143-616(-)
MTDQDTQTTPKQVSAFRKGDIIILDNQVCKVVDMSTAKTGKHGGAKVHLITMSVFGGKKVEQIAGSTATLPTAEMKKSEYILQDIDYTDDQKHFASLFDAKTSSMRDDLAIPQTEVGQKIEKEFEEKADNEDILVTVFKCLGQEQIMEYKKKEAETQ